MTLTKCMTALFWALLSVLTSVCVGCSGSLPTVKDRRADFHEYRTFQWVNQEQAKELNLQNPRIEYLSGDVTVIESAEAEIPIRSQVESSLKKGGYALTEEGPPDFYITFYYRAPNGRWLSSWSGTTDGIWNTPTVMFPNYNRSLTRNYVEGSVILTIYDGISELPVWAGMSKDVEIRGTIDYTQLGAQINELLAKFETLSGEKVG